MWKTQGQSLSQEDSMEKKMAWENPMHGGVWWATVYGVEKSWT